MFARGDRLTPRGGLGAFDREKYAEALNLTRFIKNLHCN
jgi:hypothetical protein